MKVKITNNEIAAIEIPSQRAMHRSGSGRTPSELVYRQDDQEDDGVDKQAVRQCIRTDPDGPLSEALTGRNQE
jgi:hypothetical protein